MSSVGPVVVLASFNLDLVVRASRLPGPGETVLGSTYDTFLGGKGFNQAVAARRAGADVVAIGRLGDDEPASRFRAELAAEGIDDAHVAVDAAGTGIASILVDAGGENSIVVVPRANHAIGVADVAASHSTIAGAGAVLLQLEVPVDAVVAAATAAHAAGVPVLLNPAPAADVLDRFAGIVDVVLPNRGEAALLTGRDEDAEPEALAAAVRDRTDAAVVLTLGAGGALVLDAAGADRLAPHAVTAIDTVGAGDAFCGALAARLAAGDDLRAAAAHANAAGALATTRRGASPSMPTASEIAALLATSEG